MVIDDGTYRKFLFQFLSSIVLIIVVLVLRLAAMSDDEESKKCLLFAAASLIRQRIGRCSSLMCALVPRMD